MSHEPPKIGRANGRSLKDFEKLGPLRSAEKRFLDQAFLGEECKIGETIPTAKTDNNSIRASFLRFLLLGGDEQNPVHEKGIKLRGAFIEGELDLENTKVCSFWLHRCFFEQRIYARNAHFIDVDLSECHLNSLDVSVAKIAGQAVLANATVDGTVTFLDAGIAAALDCRGCNLLSEDGIALCADRTKIQGDVFLCDNEIQTQDGRSEQRKFQARANVSLVGATIGGDLSCEGAILETSSGAALSADRAKIKGNVFLTGNFSAYGEVCFHGAEIGGDFLCFGGKFRNDEENPESLEQVKKIAGYALNLSAARINGALALSRDGSHWDSHADIHGSLGLQGAYTHQLDDGRESWPKKHVEVELTNCTRKLLDCVVSLDGFTYGRLVGLAPTQSRIRAEWLTRQSKSQLAESFRPQPFEQLIKVLNEMGHANQAREIGYLKEHYRLRIPQDWWHVTGLWSLLRYICCWPWYACRWLFLEKALGHGYRPHRMVFLAVAVFAVFGIIYGQAAEQGVFAPSNPRLFMDGTLKPACSPQASAPEWTSPGCNLNKSVPEYTKFNPYVYSLDVILPIVSLRQRDDWQPIARPFLLGAGGLSIEAPPYFARLLVWFEAIFAWIWTLSLSAVAAGIIKRE